MTELYLCDDEPAWLEQMQHAVLSYQIKHDWELTIVCKANSPASLLSCLYERSTHHGIYILDIEYRSSINGIELGKKIRESDSDAVLIYITTHDEMVMETFRYKLMALDYIIKDYGCLDEQICHTLKCLEERYRTSVSSSKRLYLQTGDSSHFLTREEIYYIESKKGFHKLSLHTASGVMNINRSLKDLQQELENDFFLCRKGCLVNLSHVKTLSPSDKKLILDNDDTCDCSSRSYYELRKMLKEIIFPIV